MNEFLLRDSFELHDTVGALLEHAFPYPGQRFSAAMDTCGVSFEHAYGVLSLVETGLPSSAAALLRVQFEAVTRAMWLLYAASDSDIDTMLGPLDIENQKAANKLPMAAEMLKALEKNGPPMAVRPLARFKEFSAGPMNSFIHSGLHASKRQREGFPITLIEQIVVSANGLVTMSGMTAAVLTGDASLIAKMRDIQGRFVRVLPPLDASTN